MFLAVDVGGTKLAVALVDSAGQVVRGARRTTDPAADAEGLMRDLLGLAREVAASAEVAAVGVGCGGPMRWPDGVVSPVNIPQWRDFPLRQRLQAVWPSVPVRLVNDAMAMAAAEHWRGAGRGARSLLGVVVSTGVGGGWITPRGLDPGVTGNAGHVGHVVVDPEGPPCGCGGRGCLEAIARGPATLAWALDRGWRPPDGRNDEAGGRELVAAAAAGDPIALAALTRAGHALGVALASTTHLLDLDRIVVGGGLAVGAGDLLVEAARVAFRRHAVMDYARRAEIVIAELGHEAGIIGAAALVATDRYWPDPEGPD